jgi:tight adherence protein B
MPQSIDPIWVLSASVFGLVLIVADLVYQLFFVTDRRRRINRRLSRLDATDARSDALTQLRRERGLGGEAEGPLNPGWLRRLVLQSGVTIGSRVILGSALALAGACAFVLSFYLDVELAVGVGLLAGALTPLLALRFFRSRRQKKFGDQFPEAVDIVVRSLRAGHPIAAAIRMAAREMPDPIGTEFGMVEDEITYGLDLETAMRNLNERVGQEDLPLFATSVSIQAQSGGNLTEILSNLSETIRMRIKLARKVRSLSSEGRVSALILGAVPFVLFGILNLISPQFYGDHWDHPWIKSGLAAAFVWMLIGFAIMRKMINFRT